MLKKILFFAIITLFVSLNLKAGQLGIGNLQRDSSELNMKKFNEGIDFYAIGNEPFWNLDLTINQFIHFNVLNGMTINLGSVEGEKAMDANVMRFVSQTDSGLFSVTISQQECEDNMSGEKFDYKVIVEINNPGEKEYKRFEGCGRYVPVYSLNRKWVLEKLDGKNVPATDYNYGQPRIQFNFGSNRFEASTGCNIVTGDFFQEYNLIRFVNAASTMMMCKDMNFEKEFLTALSKTTQYVVFGNQLFLSNPDSLLMVFYDSARETFVPEPDTLRTYRLNDIWVLEAINETKADAKNYMKGLPMIEFHINDMIFMGNGGCNEYNGKFEVDGDKIKFGPIASTRMACPGNYEKDLFAALSNADSFKIENNRLNLMQDGKALIVFKKVD